ncbi:hypothetical protein R3P38DRAFT_3345849 [Favolaschia claudopus]|uniref:Uncharacterized protein n=1 Tax=Favolaschia claudopus TaxID=2862362 RepID=A0AAW0DCL5_9AGAR
MQASRGITTHTGKCDVTSDCHHAFRFGRIRTSSVLPPTACKVNQETLRRWLRAAGHAASAGTTQWAFAASDSTTQWALAASASTTQWASAASGKPRAAVGVWGGKPQPSGPAPATQSRLSLIYLVIKTKKGPAPAEKASAAKRPAPAKRQRQRKWRGVWGEHRSPQKSSGSSHKFSASSGRRIQIAPWKWVVASKITCKDGFRGTVKPPLEGAASADVGLGHSQQNAAAQLLDALFHGDDPPDAVSPPSGHPVEFVNWSDVYMDKWTLDEEPAVAS